MFALLSALPAAAGPIDIGGLEHATLGPHGTLLVEFSVWNYGVNNPGFPPPTHLGLTVLGLPPDSTGEDYSFEVRLESLDGSAWADFAGPLSLVDGTFSAGGGAPIDVAVLSGSIDLTDELAAQIFADGLAARFVIRDLGGSFVLGLGSGYTIRQSVWEPDVHGDGGWTVAGLTGSVTVATPEPPGWSLLLGGAGLVVVTRAGLRRVRG